MNIATRKLMLVTVPILLLLTLWIFWALVGQDASQKMAQSVMQTSNVQASTENTWSQPKGMPSVQPLEGEIILENYGTFSWNCNGGQRTYLFKPLDSSKQDWIKKDVTFQCGDTNGWHSVRYYMDKLYQDLFSNDKPFWDLMNAWYHDMPW